MILWEMLIWEGEESFNNVNFNIYAEVGVNRITHLDLYLDLFL